MSFTEVYASGSSSSNRAEETNRDAAALFPSLARLQQHLTALKKKVNEYRLSRRGALLQEVEKEFEEVTVLQTRVKTEVTRICFLLYLLDYLHIDTNTNR